MKYMDLLAELSASIHNHEPIVSIENLARFYEAMNKQDNQFTA